MKKKISIFNYILVIILAMIGMFKIYILMNIEEIRDIFGNALGFEIALAVFLFLPLFLTFIPYPKGYGNERKNKIFMDYTWSATITVSLLFISGLPIAFSISTEYFLVRVSTVAAIAVYLILFFTSYLWEYCQRIDTLKTKKKAWQSFKKLIKVHAIIFLIFVIIPVAGGLIWYKNNENRIEKIKEYVLFDIQNPNEASEGYLSIVDIKNEILSDYYPKDVYYCIIIYGDGVGFATYTDSSAGVNVYTYEKTDDGYKFKHKIVNGSISKSDIEKYDGVFEN